MDKAIEIDPNNAAAYYNRGMIYWEKGEKNLACRDMKIAAKLEFEPAKKWLVENCKN